MRGLTNCEAKCLFFDFEPAAGHSELLSQLTSGGLTDVEELNAADIPFSVEVGSGGLCRQFAGLSVGKAEPAHDLTFVEGVNAAGMTIRIGKRPFFVSATRRKCEMLLLASRQAANLDEAVPRGTSLLNWFSRLAPLLMFLRWTEGTQCWHNDTPRACLVLDDPLLQKKYGFLD